MGWPFDDLGDLDLAGHVRRWSDPRLGEVDADVNDWLYAVQSFTPVLTHEWKSLDRAGWSEASEAWAALLAAAERSTGGQHGEWVQRDIGLTVTALDTMAPDPDVPLLDPGRVLTRALDAMPMTPGEARRLAARWGKQPGPHWRDLPREEIRQLRMIRQLLNPARLILPLLENHPRAVELAEWQEVYPMLP